MIAQNRSPQGVQADLCLVSTCLCFDMFDGNASAHTDYDEIKLDAGKLDDLRHRKAWSVFKITKSRYYARSQT